MSAADVAAEIDRILSDDDESTRRVVLGIDAESSIVESSTLGYREGMRHEVRTAPKWREPLEEFRTHMRARKMSEKSIYLRIYHLRVMSNAFRNQSPWTLTTRDLESYMASLDHLAQRTMRSNLSSIRQFYKFGYRERYVIEDPAIRLDGIEDVPGEPRPASDRDIRDAMDRATPRTKIAIMLEAYCGLRQSETVKVHTRDVVWDLHGTPFLKVIGKRRKPRKIEISPLIATMITDHPEGWLFPSQKGINAHITPGYLGDLMRLALPPGVTPHMLRHRYGSAVYAGNNDIRAVQVLLGHSSVATTQVYTAVPNGSISRGVAAASVLHV
jgi:site-specific recombinase XerD